MIALYVALGGAAGSVARYALGVAMHRWSGAEYPLGTLIVNATGSLLLGFLFYALTTHAVAPEWRALLTTGFCGGYTTFSTFSHETARLLQDGRTMHAVAYVAASVMLSIAGTFAGYALARR